MNKRIKILRRKGYSIEDLKKSYFKHKSTRKVGKEVGLCRQTVAKILQDVGVVMKSGRRKGQSNVKPSYHSGAFAQWLQKHPTVQLPANITKISELTNCTPDEIKSYIYRYREAIKRKVYKLKFWQSTKTLKDVTGTAIPFATWDKILNVYIRNYTFEIDLTVRLQSGIDRQFHVPNYQALVRSFSGGLAQANPHSPEEMK